MPPGNCFRCHQPGHWANNCPLKVSTKPTVATTSPPLIHCPGPCNGGVCDVLTSRTEKNPNKRFYKCSVPSCGFFKWCDEVSINKSESVSVHPTCPCGSGPCRRVTVIKGPNAQRSYFVCSIKKNFGACGFFKWEDDVQSQPESEQESIDGSHCSTLIGTSGFDESLLHETDLDSDGNVKRSRLGVGVGSDLNSTLSNEFHLGNKVVDGIVESVKDTVGKESIPVFAGFNNRKSVTDGGFASAASRNQSIVPSFDLITVYEDAVRLETEEQVFSTLALKHLEPQVEALCTDHPTNSSYASEFVTGVSQNTSDRVLCGTNKPEHIHQQSTTFGETRDLVSGSSSLMDLIEQYNLEKFHFKSVSMKHVDALIAFTGSYKQSELLRGRVYSLRRQLLEVEKRVKLYEAETSEFAASLQDVSRELAKSQKKMVETARKLAKEVRVKQMDSVAPYMMDLPAKFLPLDDRLLFVRCSQNLCIMCPLFAKLMYYVGISIL